MPGKDTNIGAKRARQARERSDSTSARRSAASSRSSSSVPSLPVIVGALPDEDRRRAVAQRRRLDRVGQRRRRSVERQRFTVAHELGHVFCGHDAGTALDTDATISGRTGESREVQANAFAAEFLAPRAGVSGLVGPDPDLEDVVRSAAHFGISTIAALYRLQHARPARASTATRSSARRSTRACTSTSGTTSTAERVRDVLSETGRRAPATRSPARRSRRSLRGESLRRRRCEPHRLPRRHADRRRRRALPLAVRPADEQPVELVHRRRRG